MPTSSEPKDVGELWRLINLQFANLQQQVATFNSRMDGMVDRRIFDAAQSRNSERLADVEKDIAETRADMKSLVAEFGASNDKSIATLSRDLEKVNDRITQTMRIAFSSLIAPIIVAVVVAFILTRSA